LAIFNKKSNRALKNKCVPQKMFVPKTLGVLKGVAALKRLRITGLDNTVEAA
jgi:hypothetical protein